MSDLERKIALSDRILKAAAALVALAAPTAGLIALGGLTKGLSGTALIVLPATSLAVIVAIFVLGPHIRSIPRAKAALLILAFAAGGAVCTAVYAKAAGNLVVERTTFRAGKIVRTDRDLKPLSPSGRMREILSNAKGNYHRAIKGDDGTEFVALMRQHNDSAFALVLALMVLAQLLLVAAIVGGAWWLAENAEEQERAQTLAGKI